MKLKIARLFLALPVVLSGSVNAQESGSRDLPTTFRVRSQLVQIYLSVTDANRRVTDLTAADFRISEDGMSREIHRLDNGEFPLQLALLLDTSESMRDALAVTQEAAVSFVESLKPEDRVILITFNSDIHSTPQVTDDREPILQAIRQSRAQGGTKLYDALLFAMKRLDDKERRKVIVTFSDGHDTARGASLRLVLNAAARFGYPIYTIGAGAGLRNRQLKEILRQLAEVNSGKTYHVTDPNHLRGAFDEITGDLRSSYVLHYYTHVPYDGRWHDVDISVSQPRYQVHARKGFYARSVQPNTLYADIPDTRPTMPSVTLPASMKPDPAKVARASMAATEEIVNLPIPQKRIEPRSILGASPSRPVSSPEKTPKFAVETRLIEVPLLVESSDGKEIPPLSKADFRVHEDEQPREISFFSDVRSAGRAVNLRDAALQGMMGSPPPADPQDLILGRLYLVLDDLSSDPATFLSIQRAAERIIREQHSPLRPISLHLTSQTTAEIAPSDDVETLLQRARGAMGRIGPSPVSSDNVMSVYEAHLIDSGDRTATDLAELRLAATQGIEHRNDLGRIDGEPPLDPEQIAREIVRISQQVATLNQSQATRVIDGLNTVIRAALADPARYPKTIVFLSPGLVMEQGYLSGALQSSLDEANRNNVRIYTVDASGLEDRAPLGIHSNPRFLVLNPHLLSILDAHASGWAMERQTLLHVLARETGGQFVHSTNDLAAKAVSAVGTSTALVYLGYVSTQPLDGRYHRIRVTSSLRTARIHTRNGYFARQNNPPDTVAGTTIDGVDWQELLMQAKEAAASDDVAALVPMLKQLVRKFPNEANLWYSLGVAHFREGHTPQAIETLQKGFALDPDDKDMGAALSRVLIVGGYPEAAADTVTQLLRRYPRDADLIVNLGRIYEATSRPDEAYHVYRRLLDFGMPVSLEAYLALLRTSVSLGRNVEAGLFMNDYLAHGGEQTTIQPWVELISPDR